MTPKNLFDKAIAERYDRDHGGDYLVEVQAAVDFLHARAGQGDVLEFAIGTGRIALPLAEKGLKVGGIELSAPMVDQLRAKPGGDQIDVVIGDMAEAVFEGLFDLVVLVFNTIGNLTSQDAQIACFRNAARHLKPSGRFVIESQIPPLQDLAFGETLRAFTLSESHWGVDEIDVATQQAVSHHTWFEKGETRRFSLPYRYTWPSELDLMARLAGLTLETRHSDWSDAPFDRLSRRHVSVWRKPSAPAD